MDYVVPKAHFFPQFTLDRTVTPSPVNPMGVKGVGEAGTIASTPCIVNAVCDALSPFGVRHIEMPLKPERVWRALSQAQRSSATPHGNGSRSHSQQTELTKAVSARAKRGVPVATKGSKKSGSRRIGA
jgi:hypothetical protein